MAERIRISVVVPVHSVEHFVERCVRSLMEQTLTQGVEFIFVDDASPDRSVDIVHSVVSEYPDRAGQIHYLKHEVNKGLPASRNTGLQVAQGEYVYHCDSDDFLEPDMLELMLKAADDVDVDMVWCDWFLTFGENERMMNQPDAADGRGALRAMLNGSMKYNVWNKIVRRSLYTDYNIAFPAGYAMGEDMTMIRLAAKSTRVAHVSKPLYHYIRVNTGAMTQQYNDAKLAILRHNVDCTIDFVRANVADETIEREISWFCLNVKLPFLFTGISSDIALWRRWYTWANKDIMSNQAQPMRTRVLQWCAAHGFTFVNRLYYAMVFKFVYGKIYK